MTRIYSCTCYTPSGRAVWTFYATKRWGELRKHIAQLRGLVPGKLSYSPRMTLLVAHELSRGQVVAPSLRDF